MGRAVMVGGLGTVTNQSAGYSVVVFKNPKVGRKPPRVVPFLTNVKCEGGAVAHARGYMMHPIVYRYRMSANGVDKTNQMALLYREVGRFSSWSCAVRAFLVRLAMTNVYTTCKQLGLVDPDASMREFQWALIQQMSPEVPRSPAALHVPVRLAGDVRRMCDHCGQGRVQYECYACKKAYHFTCMQPAHGL